MDKVVIACIGKYLEDSGVENILVGNKAFGPQIVQNILNGTHYSHVLRSLPDSRVNAEASMETVPPSK